MSKAEQIVLSLFAIMILKQLYFTPTVAWCLWPLTLCWTRLVCVSDESMQKCFAEGSGVVYQDVLSWLQSSNLQLQLSGALAIANFARNGNALVLIHHEFAVANLQTCSWNKDRGWWRTAVVASCWWPLLCSCLLLMWNLSIVLIMFATVCVCLCQTVTVWRCWTWVWFLTSWTCWSATSTRETCPFNTLDWVLSGTWLSLVHSRLSHGCFSLTSRHNFSHVFNEHIDINLKYSKVIRQPRMQTQFWQVSQRRKIIFLFHTMEEHVYDLDLKH